MQASVAQGEEQVEQRLEVWRLALSFIRFGASVFPALRRLNVSEMPAGGVRRTRGRAVHHHQRVYMKNALCATEI